ncbi:cilia- and flagella-associated protein 157 [Papilio machaon]|uniref:cilia- and flagella-associated protein 157 n=1 Tax=Papilio machaon TaxID=76193 RepID=UPI001E663C03|nr:cilia- and flagella-associated protein 157 [Papilio machaon]
MPPKKDKGKKEDHLAGAFTEVERTFLEQELADCNRKLARLRATVDEYEQQNDDLQKAYNKLDEERADIIAFLKKNLTAKNEENNELKENLKVLEETRARETVRFKETIADLDKHFILMKDQLTSENKLMSGKLNTLEEFRAIRDDLMKKFEKQEQDFIDQEMKYKRVIYETEKKFVIGKDKLKKEMEASLLKLAQDFQDATELRIAASTHRVIRENIAINNELDSILSTQSKLAEQNEKYKESERTARISMELAEEERDKAINKSIVQQKVINQLTTAFQSLNKEKALFEKRNYDFEVLQAKIQKLTKENENLCLQVRILEQNFHAKSTDQNKYTVEFSKVKKENAKLKKIKQEAVTAIQAALKLDKWSSTDISRNAIDREVLLSRLLGIITQYRELEKAESADTLVSFGRIYEEGDLGFIPKPSSKKSMGSTLFLPSSKETILSEKESLPSVAVTRSSLGSIKTIPSLKVLPAVSDQDVVMRVSSPSLISSSRSTKTADSVESEQDEETDDIEKQLMKSKLEIQKSIMKDLAYSQMTLSSKQKFSEDRQKVLISKIAVTEASEAGEGDKVGDESKDVNKNDQEDAQKINEEIPEQPGSANEEADQK